MQKYVTPHPGRTPPEPNIVNREDYKLNFLVREFRPNEYQLSIEKFIPETGWTQQQFFLTETELNSIKEAIKCKE